MLVSSVGREKRETYAIGPLNTILLEFGDDLACHAAHKSMRAGEFGKDVLIKDDIDVVFRKRVIQENVVESQYHRQHPVL
jgi:hypothetical protein